MIAQLVGGALCSVWLSTAECVGVFEEIPNQMSTGGIEYTDINTVDECKQECMDSFEYCAAVDFVGERCFFHEKEDFNDGKVVKKTGATQYLAKPCKDR